jgi:hypothetical protein
VRTRAARRRRRWPRRGRIALGSGGIERGLGASPSRSIAPSSAADPGCVAQRFGLRAARRGSSVRAVAAAGDRAAAEDLFALEGDDRIAEALAAHQRDAGAQFVDDQHAADQKRDDPAIARLAAHERVRVADDAGPPRSAPSSRPSRCASVSSGRNVARPASRSRRYATARFGVFRRRGDDVREPAPKATSSARAYCSSTSRSGWKRRRAGRCSSPRAEASTTARVPGRGLRASPRVLRSCAAATRRRELAATRAIAACSSATRAPRHRRARAACRARAARGVAFVTRDQQLALGETRGARRPPRGRAQAFGQRRRVRAPAVRFVRRRSRSARAVRLRSPRARRPALRRRATRRRSRRARRALRRRPARPPARACAPRRFAAPAGEPRRRARRCARAARRVRSRRGRGRRRPTTTARSSASRRATAAARSASSRASAARACCASAAAPRARVRACRAFAQRRASAPSCARARGRARTRLVRGQLGGDALRVRAARR